MQGGNIWMPGVYKTARQPLRDAALRRRGSRCEPRCCLGDAIPSMHLTTSSWQGALHQLPSTMSIVYMKRCGQPRRRLAGSP